MKHFMQERIEAYFDKLDNDASLPEKYRRMLLVTKAALADWEANNVNEQLANRKAGSVIDTMFIDSGWSKYGVPKAAGAKISDWCGMAVGHWHRKAGMPAAYNTSFLHVDNIAAFFSYYKVRGNNQKRYDSEVKINGFWEDIEFAHVSRADPRLFWLSKHIKVEDAPRRFIPGATLLFDWGSAVPYHTGVVAFYEEATSRVWTIEGNRTGLDVNGKKVRDAVALCSYAWNDPNLYSVGHPALMDFNPGLEVR